MERIYHTTNHVVVWWLRQRELLGIRERFCADIPCADRVQMLVINKPLRPQFLQYVFHLLTSLTWGVWRLWFWFFAPLIHAIHYIICHDTPCILTNSRRIVDPDHLCRICFLKYQSLLWSPHNRTRAIVRGLKFEMFDCIPITLTLLCFPLLSLCLLYLIQGYFLWPSNHHLSWRNKTTAQATHEDAHLLCLRVLARAFIRLTGTIPCQPPEEQSHNRQALRFQ